MVIMKKMDLDYFQFIFVGRFDSAELAESDSDISYLIHRPQENGHKCNLLSLPFSEKRETDPFLEVFLTPKKNKKGRETFFLVNVDRHLTSLTLFHLHLSCSVVDIYWRILNIIPMKS